MYTSIKEFSFERICKLRADLHTAHNGGCSSLVSSQVTEKFFWTFFGRYANLIMKYSRSVSDKTSDLSQTQLCKPFIVYRLEHFWSMLAVQQCWRTKVEPVDIPFQQCGNLCDQHDHTEFVSDFCQTLQPNKICW